MRSRDEEASSKHDLWLSHSAFFRVVAPLLHGAGPVGRGHHRARRHGGAGVEQGQRLPLQDAAANDGLQRERQEVVAHAGVDQDVFGLYREGGFIEVQVLLIRGGCVSMGH